MAKAIYLTGKDITGETGKLEYAFSFEVRDGSTKIPAKFIQTQALTTRFVGITDYGTLFLNDTSLQGSGNFTITATPLDGSANVTATISLANLVALAVGAQVTQ